MITFIFRMLKNGWQEFWRNRLISGIATVIMTIALLVITSTYFFYYLSGQTLEILKEKVDIAVYFKEEVSEDEILKIKNALETLNEVKKVEYISREKALEEFKSRHQNDEVIMAALKEIEENPFQASLNIKAFHPEDYASIVSYLQNQEFVPLIDKITYSQNQLAINRLSRMVNLAEKGIILLCLFALGVVFAVTFNTIRLAIYSKRDEIEIMRLVGASNAFIRGPFFVAGSLYGIFGSLFATLIIFLGIKAISPYIYSFTGQVNLYKHFLENFFNIFFWQTLLGIFLGIFSSFLAMRRYLKI